MIARHSYVSRRFVPTNQAIVTAMAIPVPRTRTITTKAESDRRTYSRAASERPLVIRSVSVHSRSDSGRGGEPSAVCKHRALYI
jgi:hypothetical protein